MSSHHYAVDWALPKPWVGAFVSRASELAERRYSATEARSRRRRRTSPSRREPVWTDARGVGRQTLEDAIRRYVVLAQGAGEFEGVDKAVHLYRRRADLPLTIRNDAAAAM